MEASYNILLVDDSQDLLDTIGDLLTLNELNVVKANNGKKALEVVTKETVDLILLDVNMPVMDGREFIHELNKVKQLSIPVLVLTAVGNPETESFFYQNGAINFIKKPFDNRTLILIIKNILSYSRIYYKHRIDSLIDTSDSETRSDEEFINNFHKIVKENLFNNQLSITMIADEMGISRRHLLRKSKQLFNETAYDLINDIKMKMCHQLVEDDGANLKKVSEEMGYRSYYYFKKKYDAFLEENNLILSD